MTAEVSVHYMIRTHRSTRHTRCLYRHQATVIHNRFVVSRCRKSISACTKCGSRCRSCPNCLAIAAMSSACNVMYHTDRHYQILRYTALNSLQFTVQSANIPKLHPRTAGGIHFRGDDVWNKHCIGPIFPLPSTTSSQHLMRPPETCGHNLVAAACGVH